MNKRVPEYVSKQTACYLTDMCDDTWDKYVREGIFPPPKKRGRLVRWKWSEIVAVLDGGRADEILIEQDEFEKGIARAKAPINPAA